MKNKWEIINSDVDLIRDLSIKNNISEIIANILVNRNLVSQDDINVFLNPTRNDFHDPFLMPDMEKAINRLVEAIEKNQKILIYGDYDVDGITSITVLRNFLSERGVTNIDYYIPNRLNEGYGLNIDAIKSIHEKEFDLIITVDCGITAIEEVKYAIECGMDVIITDHHEPIDVIPEAIAIIDCKRKDSIYPFKELAGVGVVFKLIQALSIKLNLDEKEYLKYLDIVSIGTISDIVPLIDENRVISKLGLKLLSQTKCLGIKYLISENISKTTKLNATDVSFIIAPRINACGRMGYEKDAVELLATKNIERAKELTSVLNKYNKERQAIEKQIYEDAVSIIEREKLNDNNVIVAGNKGWHTGIIGIVSSKITEKYYKPTILIGFDDDIGKGSGRSIQGFDLHKALCSLNDKLYKFGGHSMAVGVAIERDKFDDFKVALDKIAKEEHTENMIPVIEIDRELEFKDLTIELAEELENLEPYGVYNKVPTFLIRNLKIDTIRTIGNDKHIKLTVTNNQNLFVVNAVGFGLGEYINEFLRGDKVDIVGTLETNVFNNKKNLQIIIKDMRKSY